jgi:hypothetical protein
VVVHGSSSSSGSSGSGSGSGGLATWCLYVFAFKMCTFRPQQRLHELSILSTKMVMMLLPFDLLFDHLFV